MQLLLYSAICLLLINIFFFLLSSDTEYQVLYAVCDNKIKKLRNKKLNETKYIFLHFLNPKAKAKHLPPG